MIEPRDLIYIGVLLVGGTTAFITLRVKYEAHKEDDDEKFLGIEKKFEELNASRKENLASIEKDFEHLRNNDANHYASIRAIEIKDAAQDQINVQMKEQYVDIKKDLNEIKQMIGGRRDRDL